MAAPCWLQAVFEVGLAAESDLGVHKNSLVRGFEESLQWWLVTRPEVSLRHTSIHATSRSSAANHMTEALGTPAALRWLAARHVRRYFAYKRRCSNCGAHLHLTLAPQVSGVTMCSSFM